MQDQFEPAIDPPNNEGDSQPNHDDSSFDAILEFHASDDFRQLIFALQSPPGFCGRGGELEHSLAISTGL
jgi:hypothetical protein